MRRKKLGYYTKEELAELLKEHGHTLDYFFSDAYTEKFAHCFISHIDVNKAHKWIDTH